MKGTRNMDKATTGFTAFYANQGPRKTPTKKQPTLRTLEKYAWNGRAKATDGCWTEPDGECPHGHVSWLVYLGYC